MRSSLSLALGETLIAQTWRGWAILVGLGLVTQVAAQGLIACGVGRLPIAVSTVLLWLQPLSAAVLVLGAVRRGAGPARVRGRGAYSRRAVPGAARAGVTSINDAAASASAALGRRARGRGSRGQHNKSTRRGR